MISVQNARASHRQIGLESKEQLLPFCQKASTGHPRASLPGTCPETCERFRGVAMIPTRNTSVAIPESFRQVLRTVLLLVLLLVLQPAATSGLLTFIWCRRRDSNSHSLRHYPLKIACLPISPRRLKHAILTCFASCLQCTLASSAAIFSGASDYFGISAAWPAPLAGACAGAAAGAAGAAGAASVFAGA